MTLDTYEFSSCFAPYIEGLIQRKHEEGFLFNSARHILISFDRFCIRNGYHTPVVTKEISGEWGMQRSGEGRAYLGNRMSALRQLSLYMASLGIDCYIPAKFSAKSKTLAYVLNEDEVRSFFRELDSYQPAIRGTRFERLAMEYRAIYRLIFCCGLRVSEARLLKRSDVDLSAGKAKAMIKQSKGRKDRVVFIADDVAGLCSECINILQERYGIYSEYLFPAGDPEKPFRAASLNAKFKEIWSRTPYARPGCRQPTIHSLRHSFVVIRMNKWMEEGKNPNAMMPYLSAYLGHTSPQDTFYYYHQIESSFRIIRKKDISSGSIIPEVGGYE